MRDDVLVYIAGPITASEGHSIAENVAVATDTFFDLIRLGIPAICVHTTALIPGAFEIDYTVWTDWDNLIVKRCTHMLMLPRWRESKGATAEFKLAKDLGIPVAESIWDLEVLLEG